MLFNEKGVAIVDSWRQASSPADWQESGDVIVTYDVWLLHQDTLVVRRASGAGKIGLQIGVEDPLDVLGTDLSCVDLIELKFEKFTDGRAFSQAVLLRRQCAFEGQIRASGDIHRDQLPQLRRVGFNSFSFEHDTSTYATALPTKAFNEVYQSAADSLTTVREKRRAKLQQALGNSAP